MPQTLTTPGKIMFNQALPEELRSESFRADKKSITGLLTQVAQKYPDKYPEILHNITRLGARVASNSGATISSEGLGNFPERQALADELNSKIQALRASESDPKKFQDRLLTLVESYRPKFQELVKMHGERTDSPTYEQVVSGARGNMTVLGGMAGADLLVADHLGNPVPMPLTNNYGMGLRPSEYFASLYGTRKGLLDTKMAVADAGFFAKQSANAVHRLTVTDDEPKQSRLPVGLPANPEDTDYYTGLVLAQDVGPYKARTVISPKIAEDLKTYDKRFLVYSPMTSLSKHGGIDRLSAGVRETGDLPSIGANIGIPSAQAVSERISQGMLDSKHSAGVGSRKVALGGFEYLNNLIQAPENMIQAGPLAPEDGVVQDIREAPQGGHYIKVNDSEHYIYPHHDIIVKKGQRVEQGDDLTDGIPHPAQLVKYRGIGEARKRYYEVLTEGLKNSGISVHPRNVDTLVTGIINHTRVNDPDGIGDFIIDDTLNYNRVFANYSPRKNSQLLPVKQTRGKYLEEPVLHYTVGTRINSRVLKDLQDFDIKDVEVHADKPKFEPYFQRSLLAVDQDEDWQTRLGGWYTARGFQDSVAKGSISDSNSTSFIPAVANPVNVGKDIKTIGRY